MDCDHPASFTPGKSAPEFDRLWRQPPTPTTDHHHRGTQYLALLRDLAIQPSWISLTHLADPPGAVVLWIGQYIHWVNRQLYSILQDLLGCFEPTQQPSIQIFAAPIAPQAGVDGFCSDRVGSDRSAPITLIVDPGRIVPLDWPGLVAHELAHGIARSPGHGPEFAQAIAHLCLGHGLPLPPPHLDATGLSAWPPCRPNPNPNQFWLGPPPGKA
jgi:hypothetical protein